MNSNENTDWPLRVARNTTGTVHAAREVTYPKRKYAAEGWVETGEMVTAIRKACGSDSNTLRTVAGVSGTTAEVTCKKCLREIA